MASINLPRALQDYFAFAETTPTRNGRRFSITLPYVRADGRLDRLQWWYHLSPAKEKALGEFAQDTLRAQAIRQFHAHIERWLQNTAQVIYGDGAIPFVAAERVRDTPALATPQPVATPTAVSATACADEPAESLPSGKTAFG